MIKGIAVSPGVGIGCVKVLQKNNLLSNERHVGSVEEEIKLLHGSFLQYENRLREIIAKLERAGDHKEAQIISSKLLMLGDPYAKNLMEEQIRRGKGAETAVEIVYEMFEVAFRSTGDEMTIHRIEDVRTLRDGLMRGIGGIAPPNLSNLPDYTVLVVEDMSTTMMCELDPAQVVAIVSKGGGYTSHSAILARALGITAVYGVENIMEQAQDGEKIIVDGNSGHVFLAPSDETIDSYRRKAQDDTVSHETDIEAEAKQQVFLNISSESELDALFLPENAGRVAKIAGIGLLRSEFLFWGKKVHPSEEEQYDVYRKAVLAVKDKPVTIRTLDIGDEKDSQRGIRYCLAHPEVFKVQLRAILRASAEGDVRIMLPFITSVEEIRKARHLLLECMAELRGQNIPFKENIPLGIMCETPASVIIVDLLAKEADFFSIGTNDLTKYIMAVERGDAKAQSLCSVSQPAVLLAIKKIVTAAREGCIPCSICGEAAADEALHPIFISFGITDFSVALPSFSRVERGLRRGERN
jgi:phosphotransferase system enzyme I (PtsI)